MVQPTPVEIVPATLDRFEEVGDLLRMTGEAGCWCQAWRGLDTKRLAGGRTRAELLRSQMEEYPPPGFLAYRDGLAVGWVGVGVRTETPRLANSRVIPRVDDQPVWSLGCFRVRSGHRRTGIAGALVRGVVAEARRAGAPGVEAYPVDPAGRRLSPSLAFVGVVSMFDDAGFRRVGVTDAKSAGLPRLLVRLDFAEGGSPA